MYLTTVPKYRRQELLDWKGETQSQMIGDFNTFASTSQNG